MKPKNVIPEELITHYIVKDYQRMFLNHDTLLEKIEELRGRLLKKQHELEQKNSEISKLNQKLNNTKELKREAYLELIKALENKNKELKRKNNALHLVIKQYKDILKTLNGASVNIQLPQIDTEEEL